MHKYKQKKWKLKSIVLILVLIFYCIKRNTLVNLLSIIGVSSINEIGLYIKKYSHFKSFDSEFPLLAKYKRKVKKLLLKKNINKNITNFKSLFIDVNFRFGNLIAFLNKILFYCELLNCEYIILNREKYWFINQKINIKYKNVTIKGGNYSDFNKSIVLYHKPWKIYRTNFFK